MRDFVGIGQVLTPVSVPGFREKLGSDPGFFKPLLC